MNRLKYVLFVVCFGMSGIAYATHVPDPGTVISYDGSALPSPVAGAIGFSSPVDGWDWYCANVTSGVEVTVDLTRTSGDLLLNSGIAQGIAASGQTIGDLTTLVNTENDLTSGSSLAYTPNVSGPVTIWVSTWNNEAGGDYSMTVSGATAQSCSTGSSGSSTAIPTLSEWALYMLAGLVMVLGASMAGRRTNI